MTTVSLNALAGLLYLSARRTPLDPDSVGSVMVEPVLELVIAGLVTMDPATKHVKLTALGQAVVTRVVQAAEDVQRQGRE